jgi:hypothetical protein
MLNYIKVKAATRIERERESVCVCVREIECVSVEDVSGQEKGTCESQK